MIALLSGCTPTPSELAHRIAGADRITAHFHKTKELPPTFANFSVTITGNDVHEIVRAISRSTAGSIEELCAQSWDLQFYQGNNQLATVTVGCDLLSTDQMTYRDTSGTLEKLGAAVEAQTHRIPMPTNGTIGPLSSY